MHRVVCRMKEEEEEEGVIYSELSPVSVPEATSISQFVLDHAAQHGDKVAVIDSITERQMTYEELVTNVRHVRCGLYKHGVLKGDVVLILLPNCIEYPVILHAIVSLGGIITAATQSVAAEELRVMIIQGCVSHIVTEPKYISRIRDAIPVDFPIKKVVVLGESEGCVSYYDLLRDDASEYPVIFFNVRHDLAFLPFSSGTGGGPKPVKKSHYNVVSQMCQLMHNDVSFLCKEDIVVASLSMYHPFIMTIHLMLLLVKGCTTVVVPVRQKQAFAKSIRKFQATVLIVIPPLVKEILDETDTQDLLSTVCTVANTASALSDSAENELRAALPVGAHLRQIYGLIECGTLMMGTSTGTPFGSVGHLLSNIAVKVIDLEDGHLCGPAEPGELWVKGPQVFLGYLNTEDLDATLPDEQGWFQTGDIFRYDTSNNFYFIDRVKDIIKFEGLQVPPSELETLLCSHPGVAEAVVVGVPAPVVGELPKAFVVPIPGSTVTADQLVEFVSDQVTPAKRLRGGVEFVTSFPKPVLEKGIRHVFRQLEIERQMEKEKQMHQSHLREADTGCLFAVDMDAENSSASSSTDNLNTPSPAKRFKKSFDFHFQ